MLQWFSLSPPASPAQGYLLWWSPGLVSHPGQESHMLSVVSSACWIRPGCWWDEGDRGKGWRGEGSGIGCEVGEGSLITLRGKSLLSRIHKNQTMKVEYNSHRPTVGPNGKIQYIEANNDDYIHRFYTLSVNVSYWWFNCIKKHYKEIQMVGFRNVTTLMPLSRL